MPYLHQQVKVFWGNKDVTKKREIRRATVIKVGETNFVVQFEDEQTHEYPIDTEDVFGVSISRVLRSSSRTSSSSSSGNENRTQRARNSSKRKEPTTTKPPPEQNKTETGVAKTTSSKQKKKEGQMTRGGVDLALVSKKDALKMAENKELSQRNYKFLGTRFNFGKHCVDSANNCKCSSSGIANACIRTNAIKALTEGAVPGVTYNEQCATRAAAGKRAATNSTTGIGSGKSGVRAVMAKQNDGFPTYHFVNNVTDDNGVPITQFQEANSKHETRIVIRPSKEGGDCVTKGVMKALKVGGKNLETMTNTNAIRLFSTNAGNWGLRAIQPDGYSGKGAKPEGWQYKAQYYVAKEGYVLTQSIDKFDTRLPTEEEHSMPAAERSRLSKIMS